MASNFLPPLNQAIRMDYEEGNAFPRMVQESQRASAQIEKQFNKSFAEIGQAAAKSLSTGLTSTGGIDAQVGQFRQAAAEARALSEMLSNMQRTQVALAASTGDTSASTTKYLQALNAQVLAAREAEREADAMVATQTRLQAAYDATAARNSRLASTYRDVFAEQAKSARQEVAGNAFSGEVFRNFGQGGGLSGKSAAGSASVFEGAFKEQDASDQARRSIDLLRQAEAGAAEGTRLLAAAHAGTALEIGRTANSARDSAQAFSAFFEGERATEALRTAAMGAAEGARLMAAALQGTDLEIGRVTKSARESAAVFEQAARQEQEYAAAADRVRASLDPMFAAQQRFDREMVEADRLFKAGALSAREYGQAQQLARQNIQDANAAIFNQADAVEKAAGRGTTAYQANTQSVRAMRQATTQAGQQLQDIVISMGSGQRASTVLAQQLPQLAFAFSDVGGKVGSVARFLAGPWGVAVAVGAFALGPLIDGLFKTEDATDSATKSNFDFANSFDVTKVAINQVAEAMSQLNQQTRQLIEGNKLLADGALVVANSSLTSLESQLSSVDSQIATLQARIANNSSGFGFGQLQNIPAGFDLEKLKKKQTELRTAVGSAKEAVVNSEIAASQLRVNESRDAGAKALGDYNRELLRLNTLRDQGIRNEKDPAAALDAQLNGKASISERDYESQLRVAKDKLAAAQARPTRPDRGAAAREARRVEFGEDAGKKIANIADQFGEAPKLIVNTNKALRELDDIQSDLERRKPANLSALLADLSQARSVVQNSISTDFSKQTEQFENQIHLQRLILNGRAEEAKVVERMQQLEDSYGLAKSIEDMRKRLYIAQETLVTEEATDEQRKSAEATIKQITPEYDRQLKLQRDIYDTVSRQTAQEIALNEAIEKRNQSVARYQSVVNGTYRSLEDLLSGGKAGDFFKSLQDQFKQLAGQNLAESLFGDTFRELRKFTERNNPENVAVERLVETTNKSSDALQTFYDALIDYGGRIGAANDNEYTGAGGFAGPTFGGGSQGQPGGQLSLSSDIVVSGDLKKAIIDAGKYNYGQFAGATAKAIVDPLLMKLDQTFGTRFFGQLSGILSGALAGYARAGDTGAVLGGAKGLTDTLLKGVKADSKMSATLSKVSDKLGTALGGAQTGDQTAQLLRSLGVKTSRMGGQVGGAIGSVVGGPVGEIVGSVIGAVVGGMLKKTKKGSTTISSVTGDLAYTGSGSLQKGVLESGGKVQASLANIIQQLNGTAGAFSVSIGQRGKDFVVDPTGQGRTKGSGVQKFKTEEEASRAALLDAIKDGAVKGIKAGAQRLLQAGKDLDVQLQKAMKFQNVFDRLDAIKDPIGSVIRTLNREFEGLKTIFNEAGASAEEFAALEELYGIERTKSIQQATETLTGSLRGLIDELTKGDNGLALRDRLSNIRADFNPMAATIRAGGTVDYNKFSELARQLIDVQRQISGSQTDYFSTFDEVLALSRQALAGQENVVSIGTANPSPFSGNADPSNASVPVVNAINAQTGELMAGFAALTAQVAQLRYASGGNADAFMYNPERNYF